MELTSLDNTLWALSFVGNCSTILVLAWKKRVKTFPVFSALFVANVFRSVVLFATSRYGSSQLYFVIYWSSAFLDTLLQISLIYELVKHVFRPFGFWATDVRRVVMSSTVFLIAIAVGLTFLAAPTARSLQVRMAIRGDFFSSCLISELLVLMLVLSSKFRFRWRTQAARIALGYGIYALFGVLVDSAHSYIEAVPNVKLHKDISHLQIMLYLICLTYWTLTLMASEPQPAPMPEALRTQLRFVNLQLAKALDRLRLRDGSI